MKYYTPGPKKVYRNKNYYRPKNRSRYVSDFGFRVRLAGLIYNRIFIICIVSAVAVAVILLVLFAVGVFGSTGTEPSSAASNETVTEPKIIAENKTEDNKDALTCPDFSAYADARTLKFNSEGEDVSALQERLAELGYLSEDDVVGRFGRKTRVAVLNFQKHNGIQFDGVAGPETQAYIFWEDAKPYEFLFIDGAPTTLMTFQELVSDDGSQAFPEGFPRDGTYKLVADIERETLIVYSMDSAGAYTVPVRYMLCSVGSELRAGTYSLGKGRERFSAYESDGLYRQYWTQIYDNAYITSVKYSRKEASGYLDDSYNGLGAPCEGNAIILTVPDAKWIWYNVAPNTQLVVREGADDDIVTSEIRDQLILAPLPEEHIKIASDIPNTDNWTVDGIEKDIEYIKVNQ